MEQWSFWNTQKHQIVSYAPGTNDAVGQRYLTNNKQTQRKREQICGYQIQGTGGGKSDEGSQDIQTPSYVVNKYWGYNVQYNQIN